MTHRRLATAALAAFAALALAACGGDGGSSGSPAAGKPMSHAEYQQELNTITTQANQQAAIVLGAIFGTKGDLPKLAPQLDQAGEAIGGYADELDGLTPPEDAAKANARLVLGFRAAKDLFHQIAAAAKAGDEQKVKDLADTMETSDFAKDLQEAGRELMAAGYTLPQAQGATTAPTSGATTGSTSGATTGATSGT